MALEKIKRLPRFPQTGGAINGLRFPLHRRAIALPDILHNVSHLQSRPLARQRQERGVAVNRRLSPLRRCLNPFPDSVSSTPSSNRT